MLKQIQCDKFQEPMLTFKEGLNVVLGDDIASNSIGKSTILMIIDFVFGGDTYIKSNYDAIEKLGHHEFEFSFDFGEEELFCSRSTNEYKYTNICDEHFKIIKQIKTDEYTKILKEKYEINIEDISFRDIAGRYARVYGKENLNEKKPLQYFEKESDKKCTLSLIKLFDKFKAIKQYDQQLTKLNEEKSVLIKAIKKEFIPKMTKTIFKNNNKKIIELKGELEKLKNEIIGVSVGLEALLTKDILDLKSEKSQLISQRSIYESKLNRVKHNISHKNVNIESELTKLVEFFPSANIEKIKVIEEFHNSITGILKEELKSSEVEIQNQLKCIKSDLQNVDKRIAEKLNLKDVPNYTVDSVVNISAQIQQLNTENSFYTKMEELKTNIESANNDLSQIRSSVVIDISSQINTKMNELNKIIYCDDRRAPTFDIVDDNYTFTTFGDTGTGTAYANLITFDLALLELTRLPFIEHDLPLLKNIENEAMENIIKIYASHKKQIFIAIDKIHSYNDKTAEILDNNKFISLAKDKTLFILNWKENK